MDKVGENYFYKRADATSREIERLELAVLTDSQRQEDMRKRCLNMESNYAAQVASEKEEGGGKAKFTNDITRKAETQERLNRDTEYGALADATARLENGIAERRIRIHTLLREHALDLIAFEASTIGRRK